MGVTTVLNAPRDITALKAEDWPLRPLVGEVIGREKTFQVIIRQSVLDAIAIHGKSDTGVEVCGVLVGNIYSDGAAPYAIVDAAISGEHTAGRSTQVTFTSETWTQINDVKDRDHPNKQILGWYHTHPGFGIFLSEMDLFIHQSFFAEPWQLAFVFDPKSGEEGLFVWRDGKVVQDGFLVDHDTEYSPGRCGHRCRHARRSAVGHRRRIVSARAVAGAAHEMDAGRRGACGVGGARLAGCGGHVFVAVAGRRPIRPRMRLPAAMPRDPAGLGECHSSAGIGESGRAGDGSYGSPLILLLSPMDENKITVSWDELNSRKVDTRLREQQAMARTRSYAQLDAAAADQAAMPAAPRNLWYNAFFYMTVFGLLGGLLAWGVGEYVHYEPTDKVQAIGLLDDLQRISTARDLNKFSDVQAEKAARAVRAEGAGNRYFIVATDPSRTATWNAIADWAPLDREDASRQFIADLLAYGICGVMIAVCLAIAEPIVQRNWAGVIINGSVGAMLGLVGGVVVATWLYRSETANAPGTVWSYFYDAITWGILGLFLAAAAGVVMRNWKKLWNGMVGGLIGGAIGGALFQPIGELGGSSGISRLVALLAIGVFTALATALVENAVKTGWLRVLTGLIAGKQFILYRNPTYVGSSPDCEIYLFKDRLVGPRHAAIHLVPGGFELENLPLGGDTTVNGKPVSRSRLRHGDRVAIGGSTFLFQEKQPTNLANQSVPTASRIR